MDEGKVPDPGTLRGLLRAFGRNGRVRIVLVEPSAAGRVMIKARLGDLGIEVLALGDPYIAFLFLLGRMHQVDAVLVNVDDEPRTSRLVQRLEVLPAPIAVVTYSARDPEREAALMVAGGAGAASAHR